MIRGADSRHLRFSIIISPSVCPLQSRSHHCIYRPTPSNRTLSLPKISIMSDPYNQYPPNYTSPPPAGAGYPPPGHHDQSQGYGQPAYGQHGYPSPAPTPQYGDAPSGYHAPERTNSYGPPQHGGFQHGQQGGQYGAYDASNPQGHSSY